MDTPAPLRLGLLGPFVLTRGGTPAFRQVFTTLFMPGASPEQAAWFNELQRASTSAENAVRLTEAAGEENLILLDDEPAFARFLSEVRVFLAEGSWA